MRQLTPWLGLFFLSFTACTELSQSLQLLGLPAPAGLTQDQIAAGLKEALRIGTSAYNQNCARCHGLEAISGGIAPNLRKIDGDCMGLADEAKKKACYQETDEFFLGTVRRGRARDGRVYMPPFEGILSQEAIWTIKTYLETRREP